MSPSGHPAPGRTQHHFLPRTDSLKTFATEKRTFLRAGILMGSPVCGLRPMRAFVCTFRKVPRPGIFTGSPLRTEPTVKSTSACSTTSACFLLNSDASANFCTSCDFVIALPPLKSVDDSPRHSSAEPTPAYNCYEQAMRVKQNNGFWPRFSRLRRAPSVVVFQAKVGDQLFTAQESKRVLQLHELNEQVVLRIEPGRSLRALEVERQPLLDALHASPLREVEEQCQVEHQRRGKDGVAAEEVDLDLHRVPEPSEDVDVVPALFVVAAWRIVVNVHLVDVILVQLRMELLLQNDVEYRELALLLGFER